jgi:Fe-S cluster assembly protein SufD
VKCTHGATVGQLNENPFFYLRTRGLGPETARRMLIHAFAGEIIERIKHGAGARGTGPSSVWERLEGESASGKQRLEAKARGDGLKLNQSRESVSEAEYVPTT